MQAIMHLLVFMSQNLSYDLGVTAKKCIILTTTYS